MILCTEWEKNICCRGKIGKKHGNTIDNGECDFTANERRLLEKRVFADEMLKDVSFAERTGAQLEKIEQSIPYFWKC